MHEITSKQVNCKRDEWSKNVEALNEMKVDIAQKHTCKKCTYRYKTGAPNENIAQSHLDIALLNVFWNLNGRYRHIFMP